MVENISYLVNIVAILISLYLMVLIFTNEEKNPRLTLLTIVNGINIMMQALRIVFNSQVLSQDAPLFRICTEYQICCVFYMCFFVLYCVSLIPACYYCMDKNIKTFLPIYTVLSLFHIANAFHPFMYKIVNGEFVNLMSIQFNYYIMMASVVALVAIFIIRKRVVNLLIMKNFLLFIPFFILMLCLHIFFNASYILDFTYTLMILVMYILFHSNNRDIATGGLKGTLFKTRLEKLIDQKKKAFSIIIQLSDYEYFRTIYDDAALDYTVLTIIKMIQAQTRGLKIYRETNDYISLLSFKNSLDEVIHNTEAIMKNYNQLLENYNSDKIDMIPLHYKVVFIETYAPEMTPQIYYWLRNYAFSHCAQDSYYVVTNSDITKAIRTNMIINATNNIITGKESPELVNLYFQPIFDNYSKKFVFMEALARLTIDDKTYYPDEFIPILEQNKCVHKFSCIMLEKICQFLNSVKNSGLSITGVSLNISPIEMEDPNFEKDLLRITKSYNIPSGMIHIEVTESLILNNIGFVKEQMKKLTQEGFVFYLDDFGNGYSNINRIITLPFEVIKFDKSIVWSSIENSDNYDIIQNFTKLLKNKGFKILFEGIEDIKYIKMSNEMKVDYLQGFYYSKPLSEKDTIKFLNEHK